MKKSSRILLGAVLTIAMGLCCFALAAFLAGRLGLAEGAGLAGGAIILGYGLLGFLAGVIAGVILAVKLPPRGLLGLTAVSALAGGLVLGIVIKAVMTSRAESQAHMALAYENLQEFRLELLTQHARGLQAFERIEFDWAQRSYFVSAGQNRCSVELTGAQAVSVLGSLREAEGVLFNSPDACAGTPGPVLYRLEFFIPEALPPDTRGVVDMTASCLERFPSLGSPLRTAVEIHRENGLPGDC